MAAGDPRQQFCHHIGRHLVVTAGLGTSGLPLRIGVPPEYVVIDVTGG